MERNLEHLRGKFLTSSSDYRTSLWLSMSMAASISFSTWLPPASPRDYMMHPIETLDVGSLGTRNMLELAQRKTRNFC